MFNLASHSSRRRFFRKLGFALSLAVLVGSLLGAFVFFRVPRAELLEQPPHERSWLLRLRLGFESWEAFFYDARARALGRASQRSDVPVVVAVDEEVELQARQADLPALAAQPWSRAVVGSLAHRMAEEGASVVMLDLDLSGPSPVSCGPAPEENDDLLLRAQLDRRPGTSVLPFGWEAQRGRWAGRAPTPYLLPLNRFRSAAEAGDALRSVLALRRPAFLVPEGTQVEVLAGVSSPEEGRSLASALGAGPASAIRELGAEARAHQVTPDDLLVLLSEVTVEGLDPDKLPRVGRLRLPDAAALGTGSAYGSSALPPEPDGSVRGVSHLVRFESADGRSRVLPSLALAAAMRTAGTRALRYAEGRLWVGERYSVPMDPSGYTLVRWEAADPGAGARGPLKRDLSAWRVAVNWGDQLAQRLPHHHNDLEGRPVVFTRSAGAGTVTRPTPIGEALVSGAVWGQALANLLSSRGISRASAHWDLGATGLMAFVGAALALAASRSFRSWWGAAAYFSGPALVAGVYVTFALHLFVDRQLWMAVAGPLTALGVSFAGTTAYAYRTEAQMRRFVRRVLGRYATVDMMRQVNRDLSLMRPRRQPVTLVFSNIEGFTEQARSVAPEALVTLLHEYLNDLTEIVRAHSGVVSDQVGDAVMAFWGAPVQGDRDAARACEAVLEMQRWLEERRPDWERRLGFRVRIRVGIYSGEAVVGDMGSDLKPHYTIIGDAVSVALRLVNANRTYGSSVLTGPATREQSEPELVFREVDRVLPPNGAGAMSVFELVGRRGRVADAVLARNARFERALGLYRGQHFQDARIEFLACHQQGDPVAAVYLHRCAEYLEVPPWPEWDGVYERRRSD